MVVTKKARKNPHADTSFLPDRDRQDEERLEREKLRQEWVQLQETMKLEPIEITYSYWDGSGHRFQLQMKKGQTIEAFLKGVIEQLRTDFHELRAITTESIMFACVGGTVKGGIGFLVFRPSSVFGWQVHQGGSDHSALLHVLRLYRDQGARQVRAALLFRCPR